MGFVAPDMLIEARLRSGLAAVSRNSSYLDDMLSRFTPQGAEEVRAFFRGRKIPVLGGWPNQAQQVPCVTVFLRPDQEESGLQVINHTYTETQENSQIFTYSTFWRSVVECNCYGNNQRESTILALTVKWLLLVLRHQLEYEGLMEQAITVSDFQPIPAIFDGVTPWFQRTVSLGATHEDQVSVAMGPLIADIIVEAYDERESEG